MPSAPDLDMDFKEVIIGPERDLEPHADAIDEKIIRGFRGRVPEELITEALAELETGTGISAKNIPGEIVRLMDEAEREYGRKYSEYDTATRAIAEWVMTVRTPKGLADERFRYAGLAVINRMRREHNPMYKPIEPELIEAYSVEPVAEVDL
jgi:hypothetical protein